MNQKVKTAYTYSVRYWFNIEEVSSSAVKDKQEDKQEEKQNICSLEQFKTWNCEEEVWASCCRSSDPGALRAVSLFWESETPLNFITCDRLL